jgi:hypothetical protein
MTLALGVVECSSAFGGHAITLRSRR